MSASAAAVRLFVPGRVEFLGKHTDYAGGRSLLCAVERGISVIARARKDALVTVRDDALRQMVQTSLDARQAQSSPESWAVYPLTVVRRMAANFPEARTGVDVTFTSNLPMAAGISSSSALVVSIALAISAVNRLAESDTYRANITNDAELAEYLGCIEGGYDYRGLKGDRGVGTLSGCEDQTAMLCAKPGSLVQYSFCPVRFERAVPLPPRHHLVIGVSGVVAEKTSAALEHYNALSRKAIAMAKAWREASGAHDRTVGDAIRRAGAPAVRETLKREVDGFSAQALRERFDQFVLESETIVPGVAAALDAGDLATVGRLVDESQAAAERLLKNQVPETIALARSARLLGAVAASAFGAGFGGSVWALVPDAESRFMERWRSEYLRAFPGRRDTAVFFLTRAGPPATRLG